MRSTNSSNDKLCETDREQFRSDAGMWGLLARLWISELDLPLLRQLATGDLQELYLSVGGWLPPTADEGTIEQLAIEYCGCFLGPKNHLPPYQSIVDHSSFNGSCVDSMRKFADTLGPPAGVFAEPKMLDHAGVQLSMMRTICQSSVSASNHDLELIGELRECFFQQHVAWIASYCHVAIKKSQSKFYSSLFEVTKGFLLR